VNVYLINKNVEYITDTVTDTGNYTPINAF